MESDLSVLFCIHSTSAGGHLSVEEARAGCNDTQTDKVNHLGLTRKEQRAFGWIVERDWDQWNLPAGRAYWLFQNWEGHRRCNYHSISYGLQECKACKWPHFNNNSTPNWFPKWSWWSEQWAQRIRQLKEGQSRNSSRSTFGTELAFYPIPWETGTEGAVNGALSMMFISSRSGRTSHYLSNDCLCRFEMRKSWYCLVWHFVHLISALSKDSFPTLA